jgi:hypothetical protein
MMSLSEPTTGFKDEVLRQFGYVREDITTLEVHVNGQRDDFNKEITAMKVEIATLKQKLSFMAGFYGTLGGLGAALVLLVLKQAK